MTSCPLHPYHGLRAVLCTMHQKEKAIAPALRRHLNIEVMPTVGINTDEFGTFIGEVARKGTAAEVAVLKAKRATERDQVRLGVGSEGSFGPHPFMPFLAIDQEVMALHDRDLDVSFVEHLQTYRTNYAHLDVGALAELPPFLATMGFPSHAVVVSAITPSGTITLAKGIHELRELENLISRHLYRSVAGLRVSTDMRAHCNPMRMGVIRALASRLARRIARLCPACRFIGFGETTLERGLPCGWCGQPTQLVRAIKTHCLQCGHAETQPYRKAAECADPRHCEFCNP